VGLGSRASPRERHGRRPSRRGHSNDRHTGVVCRGECVAADRNAPRRTAWDSLGPCDFTTESCVA
jgi:hypothetical protein